MCGIVGILDGRSPSGDMLEEIVSRMSDAVRHRGPDGSGVWSDAPAGVALGHRRLSIIDLSPHGAQPMTSESGRYTISFNGEIFNFPTIRRALEDSGVQFRGHSDTEVLLAAIAHWGLERALGQTVGMFAFAIWDRDQRTLTLVRDRLGIKPIFYSHYGDMFFFGSEMKAVARHPHHRTELDRTALSLYLRYRCVPAPFSIYEGTQKVEPGEIITARVVDGAVIVEKRRFWTPPRPDPAKAPLPLEETTEVLNELLLDAVRLRLVADVPIGAFLSGGVDSSTVVALMQAQSKEPVKTFTVGFHERTFDEAQLARGVAAHLGTEHHEIYVTADEAMAVVPRLARIYDEPFADPSSIPTLLISEFARGMVTVCLSGDGGDEQFGGYDRYALADRIWNVRKLMPYPVASAISTGIRRLTDGQSRVSDQVPSGLMSRLTTLAAVIPSRDRRSLYQRIRSTWDPADVLLHGGFDARSHWDRAWHDNGDFWQAMMGHDLVTYLPDDILTKVDRATMSVGLEGRVPLLDHRVVEFTAGLRRSDIVAGAESKVALRRVLARYLPPSLMPQGKHGFNAPVDQWIRGPLREWAESLLSPASLDRSGYLQSGAIRRKWEEHVTGTRNWRAQLWSILMFQAWLEGPHAESTIRFPKA